MLRLLHVDGLGHKPQISTIDRDAARRLLIGRSKLSGDASTEDLVAWYLSDESGATSQERRRVAQASRVARIEQKIATKLRPFRKT